MTKFILPVFLAGFILFCSCSRDKLPVVYPQPLSMETGAGNFAITADVTIDPGDFARDTFLVSYLSDKVRIHSGIAINGSGESSGKVITLTRIDSNEDSGSEGYTLDIGKRSVTIGAATEAGIFYGINTLIQLIRRDGSSPFIYSVRVKDKPALAWRGMHLDVSRHFFPKEFIEKYIDILAMHKMNVFHWHLTDDQGWRIAIGKYPELTSLAAWRVDHTDIPWQYDVTIINDPSKKLYGGYYTREDIREIVKYASDRFITIVPEIEMPGHSRAALTAYPQYSCSGKPYVIPENSPFEFTDPYCAGNDATFIFLQDILTEVMDLFPSTYIHIGGDEAKKTPWEKCPLCKARMKEEGLTGTDQLQSWFISRIDSFIRVKGRRTIGWDEIMEGDLPPSAAIMAWRNTESAGEAVKEGYNTVVATSNFYYFSSPQDNLDDSPSR